MIDELKGSAEAENLLEDFGFDSLPIVPSNIANAVSDENFSITIESQSFKSQNILGRAVGNDKGALIYINSNIPDRGRYNFTEAHELGHVCMHIMADASQSFECGERQFNDYYNDPIEKQANGFASALLMPKQLIKPLTDGDINWWNIKKVKEACKTSYEATFRRFITVYKEPAVLIIHKKGYFKRFVRSNNFAPFLEKSPLTVEQIDLGVDGLTEEFPSNFNIVPADEWVNPRLRDETLKTIYSSSLTLKDGITYTLLKYDDECYAY